MQKWKYAILFAELPKTLVTTSVSNGRSDSPEKKKCNVNLPLGSKAGFLTKRITPTGLRQNSTCSQISYGRGFYLLFQYGLFLFMVEGVYTLLYLLRQMLDVACI